MIRRLRPWVSSCVIALLAAGACNKKKDEPVEGGAGVLGGLVPVAGFERMPARKLEAFGARPGFIADGTVYAAVRLGTALAWLRTLPLPGEVSRELAEFSIETGVDWRSEDVVQRFALAPDGVVSMTLLRPILGDGKRMRSELTVASAARDAIPAALRERGLGAAIPEPSLPYEPKPVERAPMPMAVPATPPPPEPVPPSEPVPMVAPVEPPPPIPPTPPTEPGTPPDGGPDVAIEPKIVEREAPQDPAELVPIEPPPPPGPSPEALKAANDVIDRAGAMALHSRFVVGVTDPRPLVDHLRTKLPAEATREWSGECATLGATLCIGDRDALVVVRGTQDAVTFDVFLFLLRLPPGTAPQRAAIREALAVAPITEGPAFDLRGAASAYLDAGGLVDFVEVDAMRRALSSYTWGDGPDGAREAFERGDPLLQMASVPLLFRGARLDLDVLEGDGLHAQVRWIADPSSGDDVAALLAGPTPKWQVPTHAALCDGALACFRTAGAPLPSRLADRFAKGPWDLSPDELERKVGSRYEEAAALHVLAASWPNLLGTVAHWPEREAGKGPEATMARNFAEVFGRIEGAGGSLRSLAVARRSAKADFALYLRTNATDAAMPRGALMLADQSMSEATLGERLGSAWTWKAPTDEISLMLVSRTDPTTDASPSQSGWVAVVDGLERMAWLLELPTEDAHGPAAYLEIPDLGRLLSSFGEIDRDLEVFRGYTMGRGLRMMLDFDGAEPVLTASFARVQ